MNVAATVERWAARDPLRLALAFEGRRFSYADLDDRASRVANALAALGVRAGDRVALQLPNVPQFVWAYLGALKLGAIVVSVNPGLTAEETAFVLRDSGARLLVTTAEGAATTQPSGSLQHVLVAGEGTDGSLEDALAVAKAHRDAVLLPAPTPAAILYTSGTTGAPKGATLSHDNILFVAEAKQRYLGLTERDRLLLFVPLFHCFGQNAVLNAALYAGASVSLHRGFDAPRILESVRDERITLFIGVPTTYALLLESPAPAFEPVRSFFCAAAPLAPALESRWLARFGRPILQGYGLTETSPFASYNHLTDYRPGSIGTAIEGTEMRVVDVSSKSPVAPGALGEIAIRGRNVMLGYWNRPAETDDVIRDGWFHSGDIGRMDADGYFFIEDRLKDMVIVGGFNVYPAEVENVLLQHPAVAEAAVHGVTDNVMGERVRAVLVLRAGRQAGTDEIIAFCRERLAAIKVPSEVAFVPDLPRNRTGKVLKRVLRETYVSPGDATGQPVLDRTALEARLCAWLAVKLDAEPRAIDRAAPFHELGLTSILAVELAAELGRWTGRHIPPTVTWSHSSVSALVGHVCGGRPDAAPVRQDVPESFDHLSDAEAEALLLAELAQIEGSAQL